MNRNIVFSALWALSFAAGPGFAEGPGERSDRVPTRQAPRPVHEHPQAQGEAPSQNGRQAQRQRAMHDHARVVQAPLPTRADSSWQDERGAGPEHRFHRGDRLPAEYRNRNYVVDDWREHRLSAPPRGYQWVQTGSDYVLVAIASGIIAQLLLDR